MSDINLTDLLSEDLKEEKWVTKFKTVDDLAKSYSHLEKEQGNRIKIPEGDFKDRKDAVIKVAGIENIDDKLYSESTKNLDEDQQKEVLKIAKDYAIHPEQVSALVSNFEEKLNKAVSDNENKHNTVREGWQKEFTGKYAEDEAQVDLYYSNGLKKIGVDPEGLAEDPMRYHPAFVKSLLHIGKQDTNTPDVSSNKPDVVSSDTARLTTIKSLEAELGRIAQSESYNDRSHPEHYKINRRAEELATKIVDIKKS